MAIQLFGCIPVQDFDQALAGKARHMLLVEDLDAVLDPEGNEVSYGGAA